MRHLFQEVDRCHFIEKFVQNFDFRAKLATLLKDALVKMKYFFKYENAVGL